MPARLICLGDSIASGLGVEGKSFPIQLARLLSLELVDLSATGRTIDESVSLLKEIRPCSETDMVLCAHGSTEAVFRPSRSALQMLPTRWRRLGWLDPRPYYSTCWRKRVGQRIESGLRWRLKVTLQLFSSVRKMEPALYGCFIQEMLKAAAPGHVIIVSTFGIDDRFFPGTTVSFDRFWAEVTRLDLGTGQCLDLRDCLTRWDSFFADHFHPNLKGHTQIAGSIFGLLEWLIPTD